MSGTIKFPLFRNIKVESVNLIISTPEEDPSFLGGGCGADRTVPSVVTGFNNLNRPSKLPGLHSREKEFSSAKLKRGFMKYFEGKIQASVLQGDEKTELKFYDSSKEESIAFVSCVFCHDSKYPVLVDKDTGHVKLIVHVDELKRYDESSVKWAYPETSFFDSLTANQIDALQDRLLHRLFRSCGSLLLLSFREHLYCHLRHGYTNDKSKWNELLDLELIMADICYATREGDVLHYFVKLGEALEGAGRFLEAASVYEDTTKLIDNGKYVSDKILHSTMTRGFIGVAYRRAGDFAKSEIAYVDALWHDRNIRCINSSWDINEEWTNINFSNFLILLDHDVGTERHRYSPLLRGLLIYAGFKPALDFVANGNDLLSPHLPKMIKSKFQSTKQAKKLLQKAVESPNVSSFREVIRSCHQKNGALPLFLPYTALKPNKEKTKDAKKLARDLLKDEVEKLGRRSEESFLCKYPECAKEIPKQSKGCPCQTVHYCRRECQVAHWPEHKKVCPTRKTKKGK